MVSRDNQLAYIRDESGGQISGRLAVEPFSAARFIIARSGNKDGVMKPKRHLHGVIGSQHQGGFIVGGKTNCDMTAVMITTKCITVVSAECLEDPSLSKYGVVILDEAHERSLNTDVLFGLLKLLGRTRKPTLKLVITSATLESEKFRRVLLSRRSPYDPVRVVNADP